MNNHDQVEGEDVIAEGWEVIDDKYLSKRPPKIAWGLTYKGWSDKEKIEYLEKFAHSMNHAASLVQDDRNALNELCEQKERQLTILARDLQANNTMIQAEVTRMNEQRQGFNETVKKLDAKILELESGNID